MPGENPRKRTFDMISNANDQADSHNIYDPISTTNKYWAYLMNIEDTSSEATSFDLCFDCVTLEFAEFLLFLDKRQKRTNRLIRLPSIPATTYFLENITRQNLLDVFGIDDINDLVEGSWFLINLSDVESQVRGILYGDDDVSIGTYYMSLSRLVSVPTYNQRVSLMPYQKLRTSYKAEEGDMDDEVEILDQVMNSGYGVPTLDIQQSETPPVAPDPPEPGPEGKLVSATAKDDVTPPNIRNIGIMDIGAGNCTMLFDQNLEPVTYFDLGFPLYFFYSSAPSYLLDHSKPPIMNNTAGTLKVILSHWDWDHWKLGDRANVVDIPWYYAIQPVGGSALNFVNRLNANGMAFRWPHGLPANSFNEGYDVNQCQPNGDVTLPPAAIMNNTGLAIRTTLDFNGANDIYDFAMTGDCNFENSNVITSNLAGIMAVHHGSEAHGAADNLPSPVVDHGVIAYSYGINQPSGRHAYAFPRQNAINNYLAQNWGDLDRYFNSTAQGPLMSSVPDDGDQSQRGNIWVGAAGTLPAAYDGTAFYDYPNTLL